MSRPESSAIDAALVALLRADATLGQLVPDGVFIDEAPQDAKRFVIVQLVDTHDVATFDQRRAIEEVAYLVKAVMLSRANGNPTAAADRIDALLEGAALTVPGYSLIDVFRDPENARVRYTEKDPNDPDLRYFHRGGQYRIQVSPLQE